MKLVSTVVNRMENAKKPVTLVFTEYEVRFQMSYDKWKELESMFNSGGFFVYKKDARASAHIELVVMVPFESVNWVLYVEQIFVENLIYHLAFDHGVKNYIERRNLVDELLNKIRNNLKTAPKQY
jgi:hypothetical protein